MLRKLRGRIGVWRAPPLKERVGKVYGWLKPHEAEVLERLALGKVVMEIGCYMGRSTVAMVPGAYKVICIDSFLFGKEKHKRDENGRPIPPAVKPDTREVFERNTKRWMGKIELYEMNTLKAVKLEWEPIDLLFIDGGHDYETVLSDCGFLKWVIPGGYAIFHDTSWKGVKQVLKEVMTDNPDWEAAENYGNMRVYRRREG